MTRRRFSPSRLMLPGVVVGAVLMAGLAGCSSAHSGPNATATVTAHATSSSAPTETATVTPQPTGSSVAAPSSTPVPAPAKIVACSTSQLAGSVAPGAGAGMGGEQDNDLVLTNNGTVTCTVQGWPGTSFVGSAGKQIGDPATFRRETPHTPVTLAPGAAAKADFSTRVKVDGEPCQGPVTTTGFRVYPPSQKAALFVPARYDLCTGGGVSLTISAFVAN